MTGVGQQRGGSAFAGWLRTGWLPTVRMRDGIELKFNPYHDPALPGWLPSLRDASGGAIVAIADNFLNFTGLATEAKAALLDNWSRQVIADIGSVDPHWHQDALGRPSTIERKINDLADLRFERAAKVPCASTGARTTPPAPT